MRCLKVLFSLVAVAAFYAAASGPGWCQTLWDQNDEFSISKNPNGPWTCGCLDADGKFIAYNSTFEPTKGIVGWCIDDDPDAGGNVTMNVTDKPIDEFGIRWEPGQICVHPGLFGRKAVVRWTSPVAGTLSVSIGMSGRNKFGPPAHVQVLHQGKSMNDGVMDGFAGAGSSKGGRFGPMPEIGLRPTVKAAMGDTIDVVVSDSGDGVTGHVGLSLTIAATGNKATSTGGSQAGVKHSEWDWVTGGLACSAVVPDVGTAPTGSGVQTDLWPLLFTAVAEKG